jgi:hypothetical protein
MMYNRYLKASDKPSLSTGRKKSIMNYIVGNELSSNNEILYLTAGKVGSNFPTNIKGLVLSRRAES